MSGICQETRIQWTVVYIADYLESSTKLMNTEFNHNQLTLSLQGSRDEHVWSLRLLEMYASRG